MYYSSSSEEEPSLDMRLVQKSHHILTTLTFVIRKNDLHILNEYIPTFESSNVKVYFGKEVELKNRCMGKTVIVKGSTTADCNLVAERLASRTNLESRKKYHSLYYQAKKAEIPTILKNTPKLQERHSVHMDLGDIEEGGYGWLEISHPLYQNVLMVHKELGELLSEALWTDGEDDESQSGAPAAESFMSTLQGQERLPVQEMIKAVFLQKPSPAFPPLRPPPPPSQPRLLEVFSNNSNTMTRNLLQPTLMNNGVMRWDTDSDLASSVRRRWHNSGWSLGSSE